MKILITGAKGLLGSNLALMYSKEHEVYATSKEKPDFNFCSNYKLDITDEEDMKLISRLNPDVVIHCAALTDVDYCEKNPQLAQKINADGTKMVASACKQTGCYLIHISTDAIFNGEKGDYAEEDIPNPINIYGKTKLEAEDAVRNIGGKYCIVRTNIYGWNFQEKNSLAEWILGKLEKNEKIFGFADIFFTPINTYNLGAAILELCEKKHQGILNLGGSENCSKFEFAKRIAEKFDLNTSLIRLSNSSAVNFSAKRAKNMTLDSSKAQSLLKTKILNLSDGITEFRKLRDHGFVKLLKESSISEIDKLNKSNNFSKTMELKIQGRAIGENHPTYFIADIAANHDGDLERAKLLVKLAKEAGADAVKFQHHRVKHYVSEKGFESLGNKLSHQAKWNKSVFQVYKDAEVPFEWTNELKNFSDRIGVSLFTTPYDLEMADLVNPYVPAFKIGSGDINWPDMHFKIAGKGKPVLIATGASTIGEVQKAVENLISINNQIVLMQCNTNYTASPENFDYINLNVLKTYRQMYPNMILGLSDHTKGHATVLGAVSLGARVIEKHFTDDTTREGPDHPFSMDPKTWREMVDRTRELERALGNGNKKVEDNEKETVVLQRRCIRASRDIPLGKVLDIADLEFQRPAPEGSLEPSFKQKVLGKRARINIFKEEPIDFSKIE